MSISAMKQALDAITNVLAGGDFDNPYADLKESGAALRQAIAEAEKQKPVAWMWKDGTLTTDPDFADGTWTPLFAAPVHAIDMSEKHIHKSDKYRHEFEEMVKKGTKAWADTPDDWVDELRGGTEKRDWVGLTDEERRSIQEWQRIQEELGPVWSPMMLYLYLAIEAKLKEKNQCEWIGLDHEQMRNTPIEFNRGALWAERYLKEKNT